MEEVFRLQSWRRNWARLTPFFDFAPEIRKVIYTTNAIESVNFVSVRPRHLPCRSDQAHSHAP